MFGISHLALTSGQPAGTTLALVVGEQEDMMRERKRREDIGASKFSIRQSMETLKQRSARQSFRVVTT